MNLNRWNMVKDGEEFEIKVLETGEKATVFYTCYDEIYDDNDELIDDYGLWFYAMSDETGRMFVVDEYSVLRVQK